MTAMVYIIYISQDFYLWHEPLILIHGSGQFLSCNKETDFQLDLLKLLFELWNL